MSLASLIQRHRTLLHGPLLPYIPILLAILCNVLIWIIVLLLLHSRSAMLGTATLAYTYGLRHALDADHISAIDNLTRRLIEDGQRPVSVGLWFSLGHSTIVVVTCIVVAATSAAFADRFEAFGTVGEVIGTSVSMAFLLIIGLANLYVLVNLIQSFSIEAGQGNAHSVPIHNGFLFRLLNRIFRLIDRPYKMYFLGILFGLGFDTSTEIALLAIASIQAASGAPIYLIMVYPALFTVGMMLIDTIDGAAMYLAYTTQFTKQTRASRLYYGIILTGMSVAVAMTIGIIQVLSLILDTAKPEGKFWDGVARASDNYSIIGGIIVGCFGLIVICSVLVHHFFGDNIQRAGRDRLEILPMTNSCKNQPSAVIIAAD